MFGHSIPAPAWNALGLALLFLAALHLFRGLNLAGSAWAIRLVLPWALYRWWTVEESYRLWGKAILTDWQLRLAPMNSALSRLGFEGVTLFEVAEWQSMPPGWGWKLAGVSLILAVLVSLLDWPIRTRCAGCGVKVRPEDPFCHGCGIRFPEVPGCARCGRVPTKGDRFCRLCGGSVNP